MNDSEEQEDRDSFAPVMEAGPSRHPPPTARREEQFVTKEVLQGVVASLTATLEQQQTRFFALLQSLQPGAGLEPASAPRTGAPTPSTGLEDVADRSSTTGNTLYRQRNGEGSLGNSITWIAAQIPEFGGTEYENVCNWIRRVEKIAQVHGASDGATLLAASSKLTKTARQWHESQDGSVLES